LLFIIFNDSRQAGCLKINRTDLPKFPGLAVAVVCIDDPYEISSSIPQGTLPWQPSFVSINARVSLDAGG